MGHQHLLQQSEAKFGRWTLAAGDMSFLTYQGMNVGVIDLHDNLEIIEYGSLLADLHVLPVHVVPVISLSFPFHRNETTERRQGLRGFYKQRL